MTAYATRRDVYRYGLPRGALGSTGRELASVTASTDILALEQHGFETDEPVVLRATEGGTLASPLVEGTTYYVIRETDSTFKLAATAGGSAINLTTNGDGMMVAGDLPFDDVLEFYSRFVDAFVPAHAVPLEAPYDITVVAIVAELAAKKLQNLSGASSVTVDAAEVAAKAQLERWAKGIPLRSQTVSTPTNLAVRATSTTSGTDPRGWGSRCLP